MNATQLESRFAEVGARLKVRAIPSRWQRGDQRWLDPTDYAVDIQRDRAGEFFELRVPTHLARTVEATVMQTEPRRRHLLLLVRTTGAEPRLDRFLCGHDEREWFVAAVPGGASTVAQAMQALQPGEVRDALARQGVPGRQQFTRKNRAFRRQGEWFFIPEHSLVVNEKLILRHEPIRRGRGKPHFVEQLHRAGGDTVYFSAEFPNGLTEARFRELVQRQPNALAWRWSLMTRNAVVYARGTVRHSDHATITLPCWHRVLMNTESQSRTLENMAFLD